MEGCVKRNDVHTQDCMSELVRNLFFIPNPKTLLLLYVPNHKADAQTFLPGAKT